MYGILSFSEYNYCTPRRWGHSNPNDFFPLPNSDSDSDLDMDSCAMQDFSIGLDSDPVIEMYVIMTKICPWEGDLSLKWVQ